MSPKHNECRCRSRITKLVAIVTRNAFALAILSALLIGAGSARAQTLSVLYSFTGGTDGYSPFAGLVQDSAGNLYGTTTYGGSGLFNCAAGCGTVFKLDTMGQETVLHNFGETKADGENPEYGALFRDGAGNLYGTTLGGGIHGSGTVFRITATGQEAILPLPGGIGGAFPESGLIPDNAGNLYGTTFTGGTSCEPYYGCGTVFKVSSTGKPSVLYSFCSQPYCADGLFPFSSLVRDNAGNLYGTTVIGGNGCTAGCGTVFKLSGTGVLTVLHSFAGGSDGATPYAGLVRDRSGNLYGTTSSGGAQNAGTVYKITPAGQETVLYSFCSQTNCSDGDNPQAGLVLDSAGNLYGTTTSGGAATFGGTVFEVTPTGQESVLYSFCSQPSCSDGTGPYGGLVRDSAGNLYGTTAYGGTHSAGTVFKLTP